MRNKKELLEKLKVDFTLNEGQCRMLDIFTNEAMNNFENKKVFSFTGLSGSGKSHVIKAIMSACEILRLKTKLGTPTGKSANVLRERGLVANTIHSLMFMQIDKEEENSEDIKSKKVRNKLNFIRRKSIECDVIVIDESSMINESMVNDILAFEKPTVFFFDDFQLPPVDGKESFLKSAVDYKLIEVVRQNKESYIIEHANKLRDKILPKLGLNLTNEQGTFRTLHQYMDKKIIDDLKMSCSLMVCGTNAKRRELNEFYRKRIGFAKYLEVGEKLMVLKNNNESQVFNGMLITVTDIIGEPFKDELDVLCQIIMTDEVGEICISLLNIFEQDFKFFEYYKNKRGYLVDNYVEPIHVTYGYASTSHKSQGVTVDSVIVFANDMDWMKKSNVETYFRALYTSATRGSKDCYIVY